MRIEVDSVSKRYGPNQILSDVSLTIPAGKITGLLGPNGSGKSTLMRMILNLGTPDSGTVSFDGQRYADLDNPGARVGALLDASARHPGRSVRDSIRLAGAMMGVDRDRCADVVSQMGLESVARRRFKSLSLGMRQRVGLGVAILGRPSCLILDEPVNGLDIEAINWLRGVLTRFAQDGGSVLVSSHLLQELQSYADRVVIIDSGRVATESSLEDLVATGSTIDVQADEPDRLAAVLEARNLGVSAGPLPGWLRVQGTSRQVAEIGLEHSILITGLRVLDDHRLEEAYLRLTQGKYTAQSTGVIA